MIFLYGIDYTVVIGKRNSRLEESYKLLCGKGLCRKSARPRGKYTSMYNSKKITPPTS